MVILLKCIKSLLHWVKTPQRSLAALHSRSTPQQAVQYQGSQCQGASPSQLPTWQVAPGLHNPEGWGPSMLLPSMDPQL